MFLNRVKTDSYNCLRIECLENCTRISEEGCAINELTQIMQLRDGTKLKWKEYQMQSLPNIGYYKCQRVEGSSSDKVVHIVI